MFAYLAQCRCDPANTMVYFTHLVTIVNALVNLHASVPAQLQSFIVQEKERYRFTVPRRFSDSDAENTTSVWSSIVMWMTSLSPGRGGEAQGNAHA